MATRPGLQRGAASQTSLDDVKAGRFVRRPASFRHQIEEGGEFPPEAGRYHIYYAEACPWASRVLFVRKLKGLEDVLTASPVHWHMVPGEGWHFEEAGRYRDPLHGAALLRDVYERASPGYAGRWTVPLVWDKKTGRIVNNESAEIVRMLNGAFNAWSRAPALDLYPPALRGEIDALNTRIYDGLNNGVYRAGFATTQEAYEEAFHSVFATLDFVAARLATRRYLTGDTLTEADVRLWVTLVRFDAVYVTHFRCNKARVADYPALQGFTRELYQLPGIRDIIVMDAIKKHYFVSHTSINPRMIVPLGPDLDFDAPHGRDHL